MNPPFILLQRSCTRRESDKSRLVRHFMSHPNLRCHSIRACEKKRQPVNTGLAFFYAEKFKGRKLSEALRAALFFVSAIAQGYPATCGASHAKPSDAGGTVTNTADVQGNPGF